MTLALTNTLAAQAEAPLPLGIGEGEVRSAIWYDGTIINAIDQPLEKVRVRSGIDTVCTDRFGVFEVCAMTVGDTLYFEHPDYQSASRAVDEHYSRFDVWLRRLGTDDVAAERVREVIRTIPVHINIRNFDDPNFDWGKIVREDSMARIPHMERLRINDSVRLANATRRRRSSDSMRCINPQAYRHERPSDQNGTIVFFPPTPKHIIVTDVFADFDEPDTVRVDSVPRGSLLEQLRDLDPVMYTFEDGAAVGSDTRIRRTPKRDFVYYRAQVIASEYWSDFDHWENASRDEQRKVRKQARRQARQEYKQKQ